MSGIGGHVGNQYVSSFQANSMANSGGYIGNTYVSPFQASSIGFK
jgi:hypothetical protein